MSIMPQKSDAVTLEFNQEVSGKLDTYLSYNSEKTHNCWGFCVVDEDAKEELHLFWPRTMDELLRPILGNRTLGIKDFHLEQGTGHIIHSLKTYAMRMRFPGSHNTLRYFLRGEIWLQGTVYRLTLKADTFLDTLWDAMELYHYLYSEMARDLSEDEWRAVHVALPRHSQNKNEGSWCTMKRVEHYMCQNRSWMSRLSKMLEQPDLPKVYYGKHYIPVSILQNRDLLDEFPTVSEATARLQLKCQNEPWYFLIRGMR